MKSKAACVSILVRFVIFSIAVSGCTEVRKTSNSNGITVTHENLPLRGIQVVAVECYQQGDEIILSGRVRRSCNFCYNDVLGHVDIAVSDSQGELIGATSTLYTPRSIPTMGPRFSQFSARLAMNLPEGAVIRTAYHRSDEAAAARGGSTIRCEMNLAAQQIETSGIVKGKAGAASSGGGLAAQSD